MFHDRFNYPFEAERHPSDKTYDVPRSQPLQSDKQSIFRKMICKLQDIKQILTKRMLYLFCPDFQRPDYSFYCPKSLHIQTHSLLKYQWGDPLFVIL